MPTGKVKWYDAEKGFGFISGDEGGDVFLHAQALPEGTLDLKGGTRVEYGVVEGRRGAQALSVEVLDPTPSVAANKREQTRRTPDELVPIIEDTMQLLDGISGSLRHGKRPERSQSANIAKLLRRLADDLEP